MTATGFTPGSGAAVVGDDAVVLVEHLSAEVADRLEAEIGSDGATTIDGLLDLLTSAGLRALGSFGLAVFDAEGVRVIVRGDARASVATAEPADPPIEIESSGRRTWNETFVAGAESVAISLIAHAESADSYHVERGVVPASAVVRPYVPARPSDGSVPEQVDEVEIADAPRDAGDGSTPEGEVAIELAAESRPADSGATRTAGHRPESPSSDDAPSDHVPEPDPDHSDGAAGGDPVGTHYDALYGHTVVRNVQDAAVLDEAEQSGSSAGAGEPFSRGDHDGHTMTAAQLDALRSVGEPEPPDGDHDGLTMTPAQLAKLRTGAAGSIPANALGASTVQALVCDDGHPNPTHHTTCSRCGGPLGADPTTVPRPVLGRLELSTGDVIELDRPILIGRNPKIESARMTEIPRVVRLDQYDGLSRSHAMIRLEGWQVLVVDLGSSNHTTVTLPGRTPRRLHSDEPALITVGSLIDFGGEVTARYVDDG